MGNIGLMESNPTKLKSVLFTFFLEKMFLKFAVSITMIFLFVDAFTVFVLSCLQNAGNLLKLSTQFLVQSESFQASDIHYKI